MPKKLASLVFSLALLVCASPAAAAVTSSSFEILTPTHETTLEIGKKAAIKWTSDQKAFPRVDLWVTRTDNDSGDYRYIVTNLKNKGKYLWKIPKDLPAAEYQLSIGVPGESFIRYGHSITVSKSLAGLKKDIKARVKKGTLSSLSACHEYIEKSGVDGEGWSELMDSCDSLLAKKKVAVEKSLPKGTHSICGDEYALKKIPMKNGVDRLEVISSLMQDGVAPPAACEDFRGFLKGEKVSVKVSDTDHPQLGNFSIVTFTVAGSTEWNGNQEDVAFSFDYTNGAVRYFPTTLVSGDATYLGSFW